MDVAEQRFCWLLNQRGYKFWSEDQLEQKIRVEGTRPDFFVETPSGNLLVEVKAISKPGPVERRQSKVGTVNPKEFLDRLRGPVKLAAKQLSPYKDRNIPCLAVLDNWHQVLIPTNVVALIQIFGTLEFRGKVDLESGSVVGPMQLFHGKDRRLTESQHTYISAVAVNMAKVRYLDDDMQAERPMRLRVVHNPYAVCPMPIDIFTDDDDEHYCYHDNKWVKVWPPSDNMM